MECAKAKVRLRIPENCSQGPSDFHSVVEMETGSCPLCGWDALEWKRQSKGWGPAGRQEHRRCPGQWLDGGSGGVQRLGEGRHGRCRPWPSSRYWRPLHLTNPGGLI